MVQRCKFSIELKNFPPDLSGEPLGRRMGDKYEIISGVEDGDQVVITGQSRLTNGMEVEIENE